MPTAGWGRKPPPGPSWEAWRTMICSEAETQMISLYQSLKQAEDFVAWAQSVAEATRRMLVELEALGYRLDP